MSFKATLSRSKGRSSWAVIFRHPGVIDPSTDKAGRRTRRGLGTENREEADVVVGELNVLLAEQRWWTPEARTTASERFSPLAVKIFFEPMTDADEAAVEVRDRLLPIQAEFSEPPRRVVLIGTTGAGKTTLLRQLIGTSPEERFPATSKARTTIHETEIVVRPGRYVAAVTFAAEDEVREHLVENLIAAVMEAHEGHRDDDIIERILIHADQRMRFNYVLGDGPIIDSDESENATAIESEVSRTGAEVQNVIVALRRSANATLDHALKQVRLLAADLANSADEMAADETSADLRRERFEEELDRLCRADDRLHAVVDELADELSKRFDLLTDGILERRTTGWPRSWYLASDNREAFLNEVRRFSSNYSPLYGTLLTPLVSAVRVAGPFYPDWTDARPSLVFFDGEGLGHTPESASALPNSLVSRMQAADIILLADNAEQPMQAAPAAAVQEIYASGLMPKLIIGFTHLDRLDADNLPTDASRRRHVLASARGVGASIRQAVGPIGGAMAERAFRVVLDDRTHFLGKLDQEINPGQPGSGERRAALALAGLYAALAADAPVVQIGASVPRYTLYTLSLAVHRAVRDYQSAWGGRLGVRTSETRRSPWQTIKALTRRIASWPGVEGFRDLEPVADLRSALMYQLSAWVHSPLEWENGVPTDAEKEAVFGRFATALLGRLSALARTRVKDQPHTQWQRGIELSGVGSTRTRAHLIYNDILLGAAPSIEVAVSQTANVLLDDIRTIVRQAADEAGVKLVEG